VLQRSEYSQLEFGITVHDVTLNTGLKPKNQKVALDNCRRQLRKLRWMQTMATYGYMADGQSPWARVRNAA